MRNYTPTFRIPEGIGRIQAAANSGVPYAHWLLGNRYLEGRGVEQSVKNAGECYLKAARGGCPLGQRSYADLIERNLIVPESQNDLIYWRTRAAHNPDAISQLILGEMYLYGKGVSQDLRKAKKYLDLAAQNGQTRAARILAYWEALQAVPPTSIAAAWHSLEIASRTGNGNASYALSLIFREGGGSWTSDLEKADKYLEIAADQGNVKARRDHGIQLYRSGKDGQIPANAIKMLNLAARDGDGVAMAMLGDYYAIPGADDMDLARDWYDRAMQTSYIGAHCHLAHSFLCSATDNFKALFAKKLVLISLKRGFTHARSTLANLHMTHRDEFSFDRRVGVCLAKGIYENAHEAVSYLGEKLIQQYEVNGKTNLADLDQGLFWLQACVEDLDATAMMCLAKHLLSGESPRHDPASGVALLDTAASCGLTAAATCLAYEFTINRSLIQNQQYAFAINKYAASDGEPVAMGNLAAHYYNGDGVKKNLDKCNYWAQKKVEATFGAEQEDFHAESSPHKSGKILRFVIGRKLGCS